MTTATLNKTLFSALDKKAAIAALLLGLATILGALGSQHIGGLVPCVLCLEQRVPYYWGLPILAAIILLWNRLPLTVWYLGVAIVAAIFAYGAYLGVYHAGVEWGIFQGPTACSDVTAGGAISFDALQSLQSGPVVPCDKVQFRFLGISLAGYNALISAAIVALLGLAVWDQWKRGRQA